MNIRIFRFVPALFLLVALFACAPATAPTDQRVLGQRDVSVEEAQQERVIRFQVDMDGPSKRVTWVSTDPAGENVQICFERPDGAVVLCEDVVPGKITGVVYAFGSMPVEECSAIFRPRQ